MNTLHTCEHCDRTYNVTVNSRCPVCKEPSPAFPKPATVVIR